MMRWIAHVVLICALSFSSVAYAAPHPNPMVISSSGNAAADTFLRQFRWQYLTDPATGAIRANAWFDNCFARARFIATMLESTQGVTVLGYAQIRVPGWAQGWTYHVVPVVRVNGTPFAVESLEGFMHVEDWVVSLNPTGRPMALHLVDPIGDPWNTTALQNTPLRADAANALNEFRQDTIANALATRMDVDVLASEATLNADRDLFHMEYFRRTGTYDTNVFVEGQRLFDRVNVASGPQMDAIWQWSGFDTRVRRVFFDATRSRPNVCGGV